MPAWYAWKGTTLLLELHVQPRARSNAVAGLHGDRLRVRVAAPAVEDRANQALIAWFAREFKLPRTAVSIRHGERGRDKTLALASPQQFPAWFQLATALRDQA